MSQNDPGGFESNFLDSDVDLEIAHPSPGAEIYTRSSSFSLPSARAIAVVLLFAFIGFGGTYYYAFQQGLAEGQRSLPPVVLAENTPIKVPADQVPGGTPEKPEDLNIYGVMRGDNANPNPNANARPPATSSPADNASGSIESLIARTEDPFVEALTKTKPAEPKQNSIEILRDSGAVKVTPPRPELNRAPRAVATPPTQQQSAKPAPPKAATKPVERTQVASRSSGRQDFMVQLAASRSRALARGVYANLQKQYDDVLGRRDPLFLRVDLGERGIFYRVNVPGFADRAAAAAFCANLKKRGQDCLVRKQP